MSVPITTAKSTTCHQFVLAHLVAKLTKDKIRNIQPSQRRLLGRVQLGPRPIFDDADGGRESSLQREDEKVQV